MQKSMLSVTPQKRTLTKLSFHNEHLLKELSPQPLGIASSGYGKAKLEMLISPLPINKDLFSQLIQSQLQVSYDQQFSNYLILQEDCQSILQQLNSKECISQQDSEMVQQSEDDEYENGVQTRKRKTYAQIKILKQFLENDPNWSKEKITQMSYITGLSQSQVYKWWWDQKKKNTKHEKGNSMKLLDKRKLIKKDFSKRICQTQSQLLENSQEVIIQVLTKPKMVIEIEEVPETLRKVHKRLTFA